MTAQSQDQNEPLPGTVFNPRQVRMLKIAIIIMSVALVLGFALLIIGMVHQASQIGKGDGSTRTPPAATLASDVNSTVSLKPGEAISHISLDGNRIAVHVTSPEGAEIRIFDLESGAIAARIPVKSE